MKSWKICLQRKKSSQPVESMCCARVSIKMSRSWHHALTKRRIRACSCTPRMLRTVDTDVVVLAVSTVVSMENTQLWIAFGTGKHLRYIPAHEIATSLGAQKAQALPMFHAFTGCDTVSSFAGKGKKTAFDTWRSFNAATEVFARLVRRPTRLGNVCMSVLESYVVLMYDRGSDETTVDSARKHMFTSKARSVDAIPPTRAALLQHARRATYQGGHVWGQAQVRDPDLPSPESWGWSKNPTRGWNPMWTLLPEAAVSCSGLLRCGCKNVLKLI